MREISPTEAKASEMEAKWDLFNSYFDNWESNSDQKILLLESLKQLNAFSRALVLVNLGLTNISSNEFIALHQIGWKSDSKASATYLKLGLHNVVCFAEELLENSEVDFESSDVDVLVQQMATEVDNFQLIYLNDRMQSEFESRAIIVRNVERFTPLTRFFTDTEIITIRAATERVFDAPDHQIVLSNSNADVAAAIQQSKANMRNLLSKIANIMLTLDEYNPRYIDQTGSLISPKSKLHRLMKFRLTSNSEILNEFVHNLHERQFKLWQRIAVVDNNGRYPSRNQITVDAEDPITVPVFNALHDMMVSFGEEG